MGWTLPDEEDSPEAPRFTSWAASHLRAFSRTLTIHAPIPGRLKVTASDTERNNSAIVKTMGISLQVDLSTFVVDTPSKNVTGEIWWNIHGESFPDCHWNDFPVVVLGWWLKEADGCGLHDSCRMGFMDGPFELQLHRTGDEVLVTGLRCPRQVVVSGVPCSWHEVCDSLQRAAKTVLDFCDAAGFRSSDVSTLRSRTNEG